jgi:hypothetical protein
MAQAFRSGTDDIDALDYVELFLSDESQRSLSDLNDVYVLVNFRPAVTKMNRRIDCGVAGYDNTFGLPPFFPTRLRFEDYIYRLWVQAARYRRGPCRRRPLGCSSVDDIKQTKLLVYPLTTPPLPAEPFMVSGPLHMPPDLLFHPGFDH